MAYECFDLEIQNKIAHIVLKRPEKRNSMIPSFWNELPDIINGIERKASARVIVISSTGPHFSAGMDLATFERPIGIVGNEADAGEAKRREALQQGARFHDSANFLQNTFNSLENCRVPVLAAIQGGCIGGAVDMVTACDMRYATEQSFFTVYEINVGMTADVGTFPRLVKLLPEGVVRELAYTGRRMSAAEAKEHGLVNKVFPDHASMLSGVMEIAGEIASKAPMAIYGCKRLINYSRDHTTADVLDYIGVWNAAMLLPAEMREAMQANAERRPGDFVDLPPKRTS